MTHWRQKGRVKPRRPVGEILMERDRRRSAAISAFIADLRTTAGSEAVSHTQVAKHLGLPLQYVQWRYPSTKALLATADPDALREIKAVRRHR